MWNVAHSKRFSSTQAAVLGKDIFAVVVEAENERAVYLNAIVVQHTHATGVVRCLRRSLVCIRQIVV